MRWKPSWSRRRAKRWSEVVGSVILLIMSGGGQEKRIKDLLDMELRVKTELDTMKSEFNQKILTEMGQSGTGESSEVVKCGENLYDLME